MTKKAASTPTPAQTSDETTGLGDVQVEEVDLASLLAHDSPSGDSPAVTEVPQPIINPRPSERERAYNALDSERDYQNRLWNGLDEINSIGDYLLYMQNYIAKAVAQHNAGVPLGSLANIRKVAAIAVTALERHGAPQRAGYER